jgi:hypothetical protein
MTECTCSDPPNSKNAYIYGERCEVHVECDEDCQALRHPRWDSELLAALVHWRDHQWYAGCSHGC